MAVLPFSTIVHADWSANSPGRWAAEAVRVGKGWRAGGPSNVRSVDTFVDNLFALSATGSTLAGFDFPIGLPIAYGRRTPFGNFGAALTGFGSDPWSTVHDIAETHEDISLLRPFYPRRPGAALRQHLLDGHGVASIDALTRRCERGGNGRRAAGCLFWTLGASQVGRAALAGWRDVVRPAVAGSARLWPFDGTLAMLASGGLVLAETYPADVYARLDAAFRRGESKRRQVDRKGKASALLSWATRSGVDLSPALAAAIRDGFGPEDKGGDAFDAVIGLFGMIDVVDGRRLDGAPNDDEILQWEGWILGRAA